MTRRRTHWTWARRATATVFIGLLVLGGFAWFPWFRGSVSASAWFGTVPLVDPLAALEVTLATRDFAADVWIGAGLLALAALLLGPVFCGWVCPLGLICDLNQWVRGYAIRLLPSRVGVPPIGTLPREVRYGVLGLVLGASLATRLPVFQTLSPINLVAWAVVFGAGPALLLVGAILAVEWVAPRLWCRSLCPAGALYGLLGSRAPLRIRIHPAEAASGRRACGRCAATCPMGIRVDEEYTLAGRLSVPDPDCTRCGACVDVCPRRYLKLGFFPYSQESVEVEQPLPCERGGMTCTEPEREPLWPA